MAQRAVLGFIPVLGMNRKAAECSEKDLAKRAAKGDQAAFSLLVRRYQGPVYNLCFRYVGRAEAEDKAQETFLRAFVHKDRFDPERPILPWLLTIAKRLCIDRLRRAKREVLTGDESDKAVDKGPSSFEAASSNEELRILEAGLAKLPEGQREAISLYHINELSYEEVAETLEVPIGTVMTWLHRGRASLRKALASKQRTEKTPRGVK